MDAWNCCRTCLDSKCLNPIFAAHETNGKLIDTIHYTVGIKVETDDNLPQHICLKCLHFIYEMDKFRKKVESVQRELLQKLQSNQLNIVKAENELEFKIENKTIVSIETEDSEDFKDYDDNMTLDNLQYARDHEKIIEISTKEYETSVKEIIDQPSSIILNNESNKKHTTTKAKPAKRKTRCKKENNDRQVTKEKKERIKEEIECEYCHKILTSKLSLRNHYKIHTGFDVVCEHCGKKFITRRLLLMHCRAKHGYEKTDKCSYCDYKASNAEQVKIHERLHTGEKPYVCAQCGAGFHRKSSYLQHVAIHLPEKTVQCDQCPSRFKSTTLMRIHARRHRLPAYRFKCTICGNSFARRRNVARHLTRVHATAVDAKHIDRQKI